MPLPNEGPPPVPPPAPVLDYRFIVDMGNPTWPLLLAGIKIINAADLTAALVTELRVTFRGEVEEHDWLSPGDWIDLIIWNPPPQIGPPEFQVFRNGFFPNSAGPGSGSLYPAPTTGYRVTVTAMNRGGSASATVSLNPVRWPIIQEPLSFAPGVEIHVQLTPYIVT